MSDTHPGADFALADWSEPGMSTLPTGTVTLLLADVEGSTQLWEPNQSRRRPCFSNAYCAKLFVSPRAVQSHLTHVYTKLSMTSRVQLAQEAARHSHAPATPSPNVY
ncbi:LuxR C-terminal-related transcriptional regulator [Mycobacterium ostraviense]|nr:LuxR C-terminal-related transcriptional regulator [Mycobacterium ostraviense]UGT92139.1 LuxR C-terminal-related transcriptional regulator [Mycobacterium ostraviense]